MLQRCCCIATPAMLQLLAARWPTVQPMLADYSMCESVWGVWGLFAGRSTMAGARVQYASKVDEFVLINHAVKSTHWTVHIAQCRHVVLTCCCECSQTLQHTSATTSFGHHGNFRPKSQASCRKAPRRIQQAHDGTIKGPWPSCVACFS